MALRIEDFRDDFDTVPQAQWVQVTVPKENFFGEPHPTIRIGLGHDFAPGESYWVPPSYALDINDRLEAYRRATVRRLRPTADMNSVQQASGGDQAAIAQYDARVR